LGSGRGWRGNFRGNFGYGSRFRGGFHHGHGLGYRSYRLGWGIGVQRGNFDCF